MRKIVAILIILGLSLSASLAQAFPAVQVFQQTSDSVVLIVASTGGGGGSMLGTGSIITQSGIVVTNAHVVVDSGTGRPFSSIRVYTKPDEVTGSLSRDLVNPHEAKVAAYDRDLDLAVLKVKGLSAGQGTITLANDREIMVGEEVVAIGHPEQGGLWTLTYGRISSQIMNQSKVKGKNVFQTDTALNRGNSGGPLLDRRGYMVGVNTNIARRGSGDLAITGVNFALKSSVVNNWLGQQGVKIAYGTKPLYPASEALPSPQAQVKQAPAPAPEKMQSQKPEPAKPAPEPMKPEPARATASPAREASKTGVSGAKSREHKPRYGRQPRASEQVQPAQPVQKAESAPAAPAAPASGDAKGTNEFGEGSDLKSGDVLTPIKPYKEDDLFKQVEMELEDMMMDIKMNFR